MPKQSLCDICKLVVSFLQPYVDNNSTEVRELAVWWYTELVPADLLLQDLIYNACMGIVSHVTFI